MPQRRFTVFIRTERSIKEFSKLYPMITTLIIIHVLLWLLINLLQLPIGELIYALGAGSNYYILQGEFWRLFTPIFLHADFMHMLFNSFALVLFGPALEQMLGKGKFLLGYFGAGIIGNIGTLLLGPNDFWYIHVGASGAIYGLFGIYIFIVAFRKHLMDQQSTQIVMIIFIIGLVMTFIQPNINVYGHVFGFIGGFALAPLILIGAKPFNSWRVVHVRADDEIAFDPNRWNKKSLIPRKWKTNLPWILLGILILFGLLSRLGILG